MTIRNARVLFSVITVLNLAALDFNVFLRFCYCGLTEDLGTREFAILGHSPGKPFFTNERETVVISCNILKQLPN